LNSRRDRGIIARERRAERFRYEGASVVRARSLRRRCGPHFRTAAADRPLKEEFSPVGDQFDCGGTLLTVTGGTLVGRTHVHELESGRFRVILVILPKGVTAEDEEGVEYRVEAPVNGNFTTSDPDADTGDEIGFFHQKLNFIGPDGLVGTLDTRVQIKPNGDVTELDKGTCHFVDDD
jgi:hypothetical protein